MNKKYMIKVLSVAVIILSISVSIIPSINASLVKDDLVEFDVEFCGLGKKNTVQLTQQEADEVNQLFNNIEQRLSEVETKEQAEEIFKEAVVELDKYGLLGGMSVKQAQRLVTCSYGKIGEGIFSSHIPNNDNNNSNYNCLIAGFTSNTCFYGPIFWLLYRFSYIGFELFDNLEEWLLEHNLNILGVFARFFWGISLLTYIGIPLYAFLTFLNIFPIGGVFGLGGIAKNWIRPTSGWIFSFDINGIKTWTGDFWGNLPLPALNWVQVSRHPTGIYGFVGLKIGLPAPFETIYLGSTLWIEIGP